MKGNFGEAAANTSVTWPWARPVTPNHDVTILLVYILVPLLAGGIGHLLHGRFIMIEGAILARSRDSVNRKKVALLSISH